MTQQEELKRILVEIRNTNPMIETYHPIIKEYIRHCFYCGWLVGTYGHDDNCVWANQKEKERLLASNQEYLNSCKEKI